jgi:hypothetical protein
MHFPPGLYESPKQVKQSPVKAIYEPDAEETPQRAPTKQKKVDINAFRNWNSEKKKVPIELYDRVQSHSTSRPKIDENDTSFVRKLFEEPAKAEIRSFSRDIHSRHKQNWGECDSRKEKEIEQLNHKIRHLIREKYELRNQVENQSVIIKQLQSRNKQKRNRENVSHFSANMDGLFEVTFKPSEFEEQKVKRFPWEVFRIPKAKQYLG